MRRRTLRANSVAGRFSGISARGSDERPSTSRLISSHCFSTWPASSSLGVAEDVRVAADQLRRAGLGDRGEVALAALLEQQRQEHHLEEDVAELVEHRGGVVARPAASASS